MKFYIYKTTDPVTIKEIYTERMSEDYISSHNLTEISSTDDCNIIAVTYNDFVAFTVKGVWPAQLVLS